MRYGRTNLHRWHTLDQPLLRQCLEATLHDSLMKLRFGFQILGPDALVSSNLDMIVHEELLV